VLKLGIRYQPPRADTAEPVGTTVITWVVLVEPRATAAPDAVPQLIAALWRPGLLLGDQLSDLPCHSSPGHLNHLLSTKMGDDRTDVSIAQTNPIKQQFVGYLIYPTEERAALV